MNVRHAAVVGLVLLASGAVAQSSSRAASGPALRPVVFRGDVRDAGSQPIAGARVEWIPNRPTLEALRLPIPRASSVFANHAIDPYAYVFEEMVLAATTTNPRGEFALETSWAGAANSQVFTPGEWMEGALRISAPGYARINFWGAPEDDPSEIRVRLAPELQIVGRVVDARQAPVSGACVGIDSQIAWDEGLRQFRDAESRIVVGDERARCDADGRFVLANLPAGAFDLRVAVENGGSRRITVIGAAGERVDIGDITLPEP
ncbi:MAG TPA: carboxypeptidase-like regulatory domain-containing protein, partial [Myxococcota bacterium]|nr:carboxypeptidase-like regulatory domain-containing protein [Myxococcota bacterium]